MLKEISYEQLLQEIETIINNTSEGIKLSKEDFDFLPDFVTFFNQTPILRAFIFLWGTTFDGFLKLANNIWCSFSLYSH